VESYNKMSCLTKTAFTSACSHTTRIVGNSPKNFLPTVSKPALKKLPNNALLMTNKHLSSKPSMSLNVFSGTMAVRYAHTDLQVPDFSNYKVAPTKSTVDFHEKERQRKLEKKSFYYTVTAGIGMGVVYGAKNIVESVVSYIGPGRDVLALGGTEVEMSAIPEGKSATFSWRGKPLFIRHRTPEEIEREQAVNVAELRDPETDDQRVQSPEWLVVIGVCTHLGCVPIADAGDFGGYYCPCHGSHYDGCGRIRKGPAPRNLEVPSYQIVNDEIIRVG